MAGALLVDVSLPVSDEAVIATISAKRDQGLSDGSCDRFGLAALWEWADGMIKV
jgi:hypothetical protein